MRGPELELTRLCVAVATERDLWWPIGKHIHNLAVYTNCISSDKSEDEWAAHTCNIAHLVVVEHGLTTLVASHAKYFVFVVI